MRKQALHFLLLLILSCSLTACRTAYLYVKHPMPAAVPLPDHIHSISVINSSYEDSSQIKNNRLESILSGEAIKGDKMGSEDCIQSFIARMREDNSYSVILPEHHTYRAAVKFRRDPIPWDLVKKICRENGTDALLALEIFDTNSDQIRSLLEKGIQLGTQGNIGGGSYLNYQIVYVFRLYDTLSMQYTDYFESSYKGQQYSALPASPLLTETVRSAANVIGRDYANRLLPSYSWPERIYYKRGKNQFKKASRYVVANNWQEAMKIWEQESQSFKTARAGRALYNMAIGYEVLQQYDKAKELAEKSYTESGNRRAKRYLLLFQ